MIRTGSMIKFITVGVLDNLSDCFGEKNIVRRLQISEDRPQK